MKKVFFSIMVVCCAATLAFSESATFLISSSADDASTQIETNVTDTTSAQTKMGYYSAVENQISGFRFHTSNIYRGSKITAASLRINIDSTGTPASGTFWVVRGDTTPDSPDFSGSNPSVNDRFTNNSTNVSEPEISLSGTTGVHVTNLVPSSPPGALSLVQELVNLETWDEGDPMTLLLRGTWDVDGSYLNITSYDGDPANAPTLSITWSNTDFDIRTGETGEYILGDSGAIVNFTTASTTDGTITVTRNDAVAGGTFSGAGATAPDGSTVTPDTSSYDVYWTISNTGLTGFQYSITLDATGIVGVNDPGKVVLLKRSGAGNDWVPLDTTRVGSLYTAAGISSFSDFTFGAEKATNTLPVGLEYYLVE